MKKNSLKVEETQAQILRKQNVQQQMIGNFQSSDRLLHFYHSPHPHPMQSDTLVAKTKLFYQHINYILQHAWLPVISDEWKWRKV